MATSNVYTGQQYNCREGNARSQLGDVLPDGIEAFRAYADVYPDSCMLLVDTYNTLKSGCQMQ